MSIINWDGTLDTDRNLLPHRSALDFFHPVAGIAALTLVLALYIAVEGALELAVFSAIRGLPGSRWFLVDTIISVFVAGLILLHWPFSSIWALGIDGVFEISLNLLILKW